MNENRHEEYIDEFIDNLRNEQKPAFYRRQEQGKETGKDAELEKMFETVRAVKRIKKTGKYSTTAAFFRSRSFKGAVAAAAAILLVLGLNLFNLTGINDGNIVHAVVEAYEELHSYKGVVEIRSEREGETDFLETIEIKYQKPLQYSAFHIWNNSERHYLSDGEKLAIIGPTKITVDNLFPERELWRYHIGTAVWELEEAAEINVLGKEKIFERNTTVLEYRFPGDEDFHQMWIDESVNLPLRKVLNQPDGSSLTVEFKELEINPALEEDSFAWELPAGIEIEELNQAISLEEVKDGWPEVGQALAAAPADMELIQAGLLDEPFFDYVLRFRGESGKDFLDIYYTTTPNEPHFMAGGEQGTLDNDRVEVDEGVQNVFELYSGESNVARWIKSDAEIFIVSTRETFQLEKTLEEVAGSKIDWEAVSAKTAQTEAGEYTLYYMEITDTSFRLEKEKRSFESPPEPQELVKALLQGPEKPELSRVIPEDTELLGVHVENAVAYVDFSSAIAEANYGSEAESVLVNSIVQTLTQLQEINAVQILVEGETVESLGGHISTFKPLS